MSGSSICERSVSGRFAAQRSKPIFVTPALRSIRSRSAPAQAFSGMFVHPIFCPLCSISAPLSAHAHMRSCRRPFCGVQKSSNYTLPRGDHERYIGPCRGVSRLFMCHSKMSCGQWQIRLTALSHANTSEQCTPHDRPVNMQLARVPLFLHM